MKTDLAGIKKVRSPHAYSISKVYVCVILLLRHSGVNSHALKKVLVRKIINYTILYTCTYRSISNL